MKIESFLLCLFLFSNTSIIGEIQTQKVIACVEFFRHGARAPIVNFEENKNLYFLTGKHQLTINGLRQHFLLGKWIKKRYMNDENNKFLNENSISRDIKVFSSPYQRTIFSAASHILGLSSNAMIKVNYDGNEELKTNDTPPIFNFELSQSLNEISINVIHPDKDNVFNAINCRRKNSKLSLMDETNLEISKNPKLFSLSYQALNNTINDILSNYGKFFKNNSPFNSSNKYTEETLRNLVDFIDQYSYHMMKAPELKKETIINMKKSMLNKYYNQRLINNDINKFSVSKMFREVISLFESAISGKNKVKFVIFSGHDDNIMNILSNLLDKNYLRKKIYNSLVDEEDYNFLVPRLAASILIELIQEKGKYYIRILYNGERIDSNFAFPVKYNKSLGLLDYSNIIKLIRSRIENNVDKLQCSIGLSN